MHKHDIDYLKQMILDALEAEPETNNTPDAVPSESTDMQKLITNDCSVESEDVKIARIAAEILWEHRKAFEELAK